MDKIEIQLFKGCEVLPYLNEVTTLRITVFREYPYLYESNLKVEQEYVKNYSKSKGSLFVLAKDHEKVIGCLTSIPAVDVVNEWWATALKTLPVESILYLGDILILKEYRNQKIGSKMYDLFERAVRKEKKFSKITFQEVVRPDDDRKRPKTYRSLDSFWKKRGYVKHPELVNLIPYQEIGELSLTQHAMVYWIKELF